MYRRSTVTLIGVRWAASIDWYVELEQILCSLMALKKFENTSGVVFQWSRKLLTQDFKSFTQGKIT